MKTRFMKVVSKPDRIGIWFYELAVRLPGGHGYLIHIRINDVNDLQGTHIPVHDVVKDWIDTIQVPFRVRDENIVLVFDNHYMSNPTRALLLERNQKFVGACKSNTFSDLSETVRLHISKPSEYYAICKPDTNEIFVGVWDSDPRIGMKYCLTNAYDWVIDESLPPNMSYLTLMIPGYDLYKVLFNLVDRVNYRLGRIKFPHKSGGRSHPGGEGHEHKFAMMCLMKNVEGAMKVLRPGQYPTFSSLCDELSIKLYQWAEEELN